MTCHPGNTECRLAKFPPYLTRVVIMAERLTVEQVDAMRAAHGRVKHIVYNGHDIVFRKPKRFEVQQHAMKLEEPAQRPFADEQLAQLLVVYPSREKFIELLEEYPYLIRNDQIGGALAKLTGLVQDEEAKS